MEKEILTLFLDNGTQHIIVRKHRPSVCTKCGFTYEDEGFFSVNGRIVNITDETTVVELLDGNLRTIPNQDINRIEGFDPNIAKKGGNQERW